jgi:hypothetical protein
VGDNPRPHTVDALAVDEHPQGDLAEAVLPFDGQLAELGLVVFHESRIRAGLNRLDLALDGDVVFPQPPEIIR